MSMVTATRWVPRGFAAPFPTKYNFDEEEFARIAELAKLQLDGATEELEEAQRLESKSENQKSGKKVKKEGDSENEDEKDNIGDDDDLKEYDLEHYDDDDDEDDGAGQSMGMFGNVKSLAYYESNKDDPYITLGDADADDDDPEREELQILATDNLLLAAKIEDELAHLEVYVYEDDADNLYVHHDIMLPAIPLCVEWLDMAVGKRRAGTDRDDVANYVAIGTFEPDIEIWDLDTIDCMYPNAILGEGGAKAAAGNEDGDTSAAKKTKPKKKKKKSNKPNDAYHVDAVLALAANRKHRNLLASASADRTVKLWDLHTATCAKSYDYHTDKVCSLAWHATESTVLLSGSYDRTAAAADMRAPSARPPRVGVESDVETVAWDPHDGNYFAVSTEAGLVHYFDARNASSSADPATAATKGTVWKLQAHDESVSCFDLNGAVPGFMATGSTDGTVKLWNFGVGAGPSMVVSRDFDIGKVFAASFAPDKEVAFRLAVAGSKGTVSVWDTSTNAAVRAAFAQKMTAGTAQGRDQTEDRLVGIDDESSSSDDDEEEDDNGAPVNAELEDEDASMEEA